MAFRYDRLKALRKEKGYKQVNLANDLHIGRSTLAMWEIGQSEPTTDMVSRIADLLDCSVGYLLGTEEEVNAIKAFDKLRAMYLTENGDNADKLRSIGDHLTAPSRSQEWDELSKISHALSEVTRGMSESGLNDVLKFARFVRDQEEKDSAAHDD